MAYAFAHTHPQSWDWDSESSSSSSSYQDTSPRIRPNPRPKTRKVKTKPVRPIKIKILHPNGHFVALHVQSTILIKDIKKKIQSRLGIAVGLQKLLFQGEELNDESTWIESNYPTCIFLLILKEQMQILIQTMCGKMISMNVRAMDRISSLKEKIEHEEGIAIKHQRLLFAGQELHDDYVLSHYQIESGCTLHSTLRFRNYSLGSAAIRIEIKTITNNRTIAVLNVNRDTAIQDIKRMIEEKTHVLSPFDFEDEPLQLMFAEQTLQNTLSLSDYHIYNNSTLYLQFTNDAYDHYYDAYDGLSSDSSLRSCTSSLSRIPEIQETFEISVLIPQTDRVIQVEVDYNDTLQRIKEQIEVQEMIPCEDQILIYFDQTLDDDKTLCHYDIDCQSELHLKLQGFAKFVTDKLVY